MGQISLELYLIIFSNLSKLSSPCNPIEMRVASVIFSLMVRSLDYLATHNIFFASSQMKRKKIRRVRTMVVRNANLFFCDGKKMREIQ